MVTSLYRIPWEQWRIHWAHVHDHHASTITTKKTACYLKHFSFCAYISLCAPKFFNLGSLFPVKKKGQYVDLLCASTPPSIIPPPGCRGTTIRHQMHDVQPAIIYTTVWEISSIIISYDKWMLNSAHPKYAGYLHGLKKTCGLWIMYAYSLGLLCVQPHE